MRVLAVVLLACVLAAPAASRTRIELAPLPGTSAGRVDGTRAFIAVSLDRGRLRVYVCDGTLRRDATIATWFRGRWDGRRALTLRAGGHVLELDPIGIVAGVSGRLDGHAFAAKPAEAPAGLFRGRGGGLRATWIVLPGGAGRGTFAPTRPPKCRFVLVTSPTGAQQWVTVC